DAKVGAVAVRADAHHIPRRVCGGESAGLVFGGVERAVAAEAAALHEGQAAGPDRWGVPGDDPPDTRVHGGVEATEQFPDVQRAVWAARDACRHSIALCGWRDPEKAGELVVSLTHN